MCSLATLMIFFLERKYIVRAMSGLATCMQMQNDLKYTNNIPAQFFSYFLYYMKPDIINIIISGITDLPL